MSTSINGIFFLDSIKFIIAIFFAFYIPGRVFIGTLVEKMTVRHALSFVVGMGMWVVIGTLLGKLGIREGMYVYLFICVLLFFLKYRKSLRTFSLSFHFDPYITAIIFFGVLIQVSGVWFMGIETLNGLLACCGHVPDNTLFLSITNELVHNFPPNEPGIVGIPLGNYHYLSHLFVADLIRVFHLPLVATSFQFTSLVVSISLGLSGYVFAEVLGLNRRFIRWLLFFLYFGADAVFLLVLFLNTQFLFYFSAMESGAGFLFNYPRAFSIVFMFTGLSLLVLWIRKSSVMLGLLIVSILSSVIALKAYTGVFVWSGMFGLFCWALLKKDIKSIILAVLTVACSIIFFLPGGGDSGGMFFSGLWRVHDFFAMPELGLSHWLLARNIFIEHMNWPRIAVLDITMTILFIWVTFGTKLIALFQTKQSLSRFPLYMHAFLLLAIVSSFIVGMFFLQKIGGSTSVNFLITAVIMISIYTALTLAYGISFFPRSLYAILSISVIVITVPRALNVAYENSLKIGKIVVPKEDVEFFNTIRKTIPYEATILPVGYSSEYTDLYLTYFTDKPIYVLSSMNSERAKNEEQNRRKIFTVLESETDINVLSSELNTRKIDYLLVRKSSTIPLYESEIFTEIMEAPCCRLYKFSEL